MAKYILPRPDSKLDRLVGEFFERKGIDPKDVLSYRFDREPQGRSTLTVELWYDEGPPPMVGESTPETVNNPRDDGSAHPLIKR